jgi:hypothetical protein
VTRQRLYNVDGSPVTVEQLVSNHLRRHPWQRRPSPHQQEEDSIMKRLPEIERLAADLEAFAHEPTTLDQELLEVEREISEAPGLRRSRLARQHALEDAKKEIFTRRAKERSIQLFRIGQATLDLQRTIPPQVEQAKELPNDLLLFVRRHDLDGITVNQRLGVKTLSALLRREVREIVERALPTEALALYQRAVATGDEEADHVAREIEHRHGAGWRGPLPTSPDESAAEATAAMQLRSLIATTRQSRVPAELQEALEVLEQAEKVHQRATEIEGVRPVNPEVEPTGTASIPANVERYLLEEVK